MAFFFKEYNRLHRKIQIFILAMIFLVSGFVMHVYATEGIMKDRPGAKADEEHSAPVSYPDVYGCSPLMDPDIYKGSHKILKFIYPGKDGFLFRSADFRTDFSIPDKTLFYMKQVNARLKRKGVDLVVIVQPPRAVQMTDYLDPAHIPEGYDPDVAKRNFKGFLQKLNSEGITAVDLTNPPKDVRYFFKGDPHWRREGAQWSAEKVAEVVRQNPKYKDIPKEEFAIEITWWLESEKGEFDEFVEGACNVTWPPDRRPMWATTSLTNDVSSDSLFGDVTYPDIAIVGTSNTAHEEDFNFAGSLKQALHADVRNRALSAGGFSGASLVYYATDEFQEHPPKVLLWEFLAHHDYNDYVGLRQMLPAIDGVCKSEDALAETEVKITPSHWVAQKMAQDAAAANAYGPMQKAKSKKPLVYDFTVFRNLDDKKILGKGSYLYMEVTNPEIRVLHAGILYTDGEADQVDLSRSLRVDNNGKYYLLFNPDIDKDVAMVQIETDKMVGDVKARICKDNGSL
ncbi:MAG: hypothetical protein KDI13_06610 [Alphaproteobacteria bacterium]|nr:hypothetical protein [Alphaproteobacteria bacterium]